MAWAEGLAAGLGTVAAGEQVVLAALWEPTGVLSSQLWRQGIPREQVLEALAALGVSVPKSPLPTQGDAAWDAPVYFPAERMNEVFARMRPMLVPGETPFGANTVTVEGRRIGWVMGHPSLCLADVVRDVLGAAPLAPPAGAPSKPHRSPWGRAPRPGGAVLGVAMEEASRRRREACGDELVLLALAMDETTRAGAALASLGVTAEDVSARVGGDDPTEPTRGVTHAPALYSMEARAQGLAAALGSGDPSSEHLGLALAWDPYGASGDVLAGLGVERADLVVALARQGASIPAQPPPPAQAFDWGGPIAFPRKGSGFVASLVRAHLDPANPLRFGYGQDHAWVSTEASINASDLVMEATRALPK
ncbi:MAG: Clp protease N-terminal domain-containing protein [Acidimicrobiales bacterium]